MFIDSRELPDGSVLTGQICIIGAGAAGITMALELAGSGLDVIVL
jgi:heterodisulfide reductase subunit A-like polyferredoxin